MTKKLEEYSREELIEEIKSLKRRKKFGLVWEDKKEEIVEKCKNEIPVLKEVPELAINERPGEPTNLIIEGDNFASLQVLNYTHHGKIDVIYIDPPYNTGNKDFIYNDSYIDSEDSFRHSKWLSFMDRRLRLAKELLSDDGVIFISIDDNEQAQLKMMCDEIFGRRNFVANFIWEKKRKASNLSNQVRDITEYLLCYRKDNPVLLVAPDDIAEDNKPYPFYNTGNKRQTLFFPGGYVTTEMKDGEYPAAEYVDKKTKVVLLDDIRIENGVVANDFRLEGEWRYSQKSLNNLINNNELIVLKGNKFKPYFINNSERVKCVKTLLSRENYDVGTNEDGNAELAQVLENNVFAYPKPSKLIRKIIQFTQKKDAIILDFFAGSGTTGQAVLELNKEDGGNRKFILCTYGKENEKSEINISRDITYPRIKTVVTGIRPDGSKYSDGISANVRYFTTDFIEKGITGDETRAKLFEKSDEMIQVRENTFEFVDKNDNYTFYKNNEKFVAIIKDPFNFGPIWYELEEKNTEKLPVKLYVFSYSNYTFEDEIPDTDLKYEICAIPNSIMEVYRKISDKKEERQ